MKIHSFIFALACIWSMPVHPEGSKQKSTLPSADSIYHEVLTPLEAAKLGFSVKSRTKIPPSQWELEKFSLSVKRRTDLKSTFPSHLGKTSYYRFTIEEETYADSTKAKFRLDSLRVMPPDLDVENQKSFPLRRGFQEGNRVIVVSTDVTGYKRKLGELTDALDLLASASESQGRIRLLDSLGRALRIVRR